LPSIDDPLELTRAALAGSRAWLVGGAVRDRLLRDAGGIASPGAAAGAGGIASAGVAASAGAAAGAGGIASPGAAGGSRAAGDPDGGDRTAGTRRRETADLDVVLDGEPREAARALVHAAGRSSIGGAVAFALSEEYGGWRVVARNGAWQVDFERLRGATLEEDLALRDFTVNAIAEPLEETGAAAVRAIDPLGGVQDLARRRLREAGPRAFAEDPLRVLRLVRLAIELDLEPDSVTRGHARAHAAGLREVAVERVFMELCRVLDAPGAVRGLALMGELGATAVVLPELEALRGVTQSHYHHLDVYGHTMEVLERTIALQREPAVILSQGPSLAQGHILSQGPSLSRGRSDVGSAPRGAGRIGAESVGGEIVTGEALFALLREPLADGLTRGGALRWGALLHDAAKPLTREVRPADARVTFIGHDVLGAQLAGDVLGRLRASSRLRGHVAALVRHHLRLGFLVHEPQPLHRRSVFAYLRACEPVEVDVTLLSIADRLATRGERAQEAIDTHLRLARRVLVDAVGWRAEGPPTPLLRGDELADELGLRPGPRLGELLEELLQAQYAGEISTREDALAYARSRGG
jgi:poly(A) polymerase